MIFYVTFLRALAACLITNAHYTGIYPTDLIANGGLIGDVLFFAVSGYCLYNIKVPFHKWYFKRIIRVYVPVWIISVVFLILGCFSFEDHSFLYYFVYPTDYHFVASIILLYIPFYIVCSLDWTRKRIPQMMLIVAGAMVAVYLLIYDKSYYHIDTVREPFIRFLFFESMLLGAYFKKEDHIFRNKFSWRWVWLTVLSLGVYFVSKIVFSKSEVLSEFQIINQILIFGLLYCLLRLFSGLDGKLEKMPVWIRNCISFVAGITLEIYVVQYVLIDALRGIAVFPLNWMIVTGSIILSALLLHLVCKLFYSAGAILPVKNKK